MNIRNRKIIPNKVAIITGVVINPPPFVLPVASGSKLVKEILQWRMISFNEKRTKRGTF